MKGKKSLALSVVCAMAMSVLPLFEGTAAMNADAAFEQTAAEITEDMGFGWNLGNSLDSYVGTTFGCQDLSSETCWGNPKSTQTLIDGVKASGVNTIRVPVTWYNHMDPNTYEIDDAWMDRVEEVVNYVLKNDDTYCILNVHHDTGENGWLKASSNNLDTKKAIFTAIWEQIAERFGSYGDRLIFEGFNEILDDNSEWVNPSQESLTIVNDLNQIFVDTVRASGGSNAQRCLIVNTYAASGNPYVTSNFEIPDDSAQNKIIAECHVYQPFYFTSEFYPDETTWEQNKYYLDEQLDAIYNNFIQKGTPAIIGEFGCAYTKDNMDEILSWAKYYVETCTDYGIPCIYWDNGSQYKLYNRTTGSVTQENLLNTMLAASEGEDYVVDTTLYGDADGNGKLEDADVKQLQDYLLCRVDSVRNCDMNKDNVVDAFDLAILKRTLAQKNNMCSSMDNWSSWVDTSSGAAGDVTYTDNGVIVDVQNGGANPWEVQVAYKNITLEQGATYKISYDYSCTVAQSMDGNVMQNYGDYMPYYNMPLDYTTETQHYEGTFTMEDATDKNTQVAFNCGGEGLIPCRIEISNLSLVKVTGGISDSGGSDNGNNDSSDNNDSDDENHNDNSGTVDGTNLCADSANWGGWVYEDGAAATITTNSDGITMDVTNAGTEEWYIQGSYSNLTLEQGATYRVEFDYTASDAVAMGFHVQQNYDPYGQYHYESVNCTTSAQHYTAEFTMTETDDNVVCVFNCGGVDTAVPFSITVQNLRLVRIS